MPIKPLKPKKYPKSCPACGSKDISVNPFYGMRCNKCGFDNIRFVSKKDMQFKILNTRRTNNK